MANVFNRAAAVLGLAMFIGVATGCAQTPGEPTRLPTGLHSPFAGYASPRYRDPARWLCLPDRQGDACRADLTATEIRRDNSRVIAPHVPAANPDVDCFYVYPTVDLGLAPANHDDFTDLSPMARTAVAQAARFSEACTVYVPLYRQATIGSYFRSTDTLDRYLATAFSDVADAFLHYMGQYNKGHKIVLIGHSQGAEMVIRLLKQYFDDDPSMRARLLVAMAIGGDVEVPEGQDVGATFKNIPACTRTDEAACVVAYHSFRANDDAAAWNPPKDGNVTLCVDPANLAGVEWKPFSRTYLPLGKSSHGALRGVEGIKTPFVMLRDFYWGRCVNGPDGFRYLEISATPASGDARTSPIDLGDWALRTKLGLHILDMQFPQGDLIDMVKTRAGAAHTAKVP